MNDQTNNNKPSTEIAKVDDNAPLGVQLKYREKQFVASLPAHMPVERYMRVVMTAVQQNPALWKADRRSFWNSCMIAAVDGLLPDGREGALVVYKTKIAGEWVAKVVWNPMVAGVRKKVRNSGTIATWDVQAVYQKDHFEFELGDNPFIRHRPYLPTTLERQAKEADEDFAARLRSHISSGPLIAAYSVAVLKTGEKSRDVMTRAEIDYVRDTYSKRDSKGNFSPAWVKSYGEMAKKTVAKRHSKVLPMSTDLDDLMRRDEELYDMKGGSDKQIDKGPRSDDLGDRMDALLGAVTPDEDQSPPDDDSREYVDPETGEYSNVASAASKEGEKKPADPPVTSGKQTPTEPSTRSADAKEGGKATKAATPSDKPAGALSDQEMAVLEDIVQSGSARAESGEKALRHFLDQDLTDAERKLIPSPTVTAWIKTARGVDKAAAKGGRA